MSSFGTDYSLETNTDYDLGFDLDTDFPLFPDLPASGSMEVAMSSNWFSDGSAGFHTPMHAESFHSASRMALTAPVGLADVDVFNLPPTPQSLSTTPLSRSLSGSGIADFNTPVHVEAMQDAFGAAQAGPMAPDGLAEMMVHNLPPTPQSFSTTPMSRTISGNSIPGSATTHTSGGISAASYMAPGLQYSSPLAFSHGSTGLFDTASARHVRDTQDSLTTLPSARKTSAYSVPESVTTYTSGDATGVSAVSPLLHSSSQSPYSSSSYDIVDFHDASAKRRALPSSINHVIQTVRPTSDVDHHTLDSQTLPSSAGSAEIHIGSPAGVSHRTRDKRAPSSSVENVRPSTGLVSYGGHHSLDSRSSSSAILNERAVRSTGVISGVTSRQVGSSSANSTALRRTTMSFANADRQNQSAGLDYYAQVPADRQPNQSTGIHFRASPSSIEVSIQDPIQNAGSWALVTVWAVIACIFLLFGAGRSNSLAKSAATSSVHCSSHRLIASRLTTSLASWTLLALAVISNTSCRLRLKTSSLSAPCRASNILCSLGLVRPADPTTSTPNSSSSLNRPHLQSTKVRTSVRKPLASLGALARQSVCQLTERVGNAAGERWLLF
jgi:hypothetical protein